MLLNAAAVRGLIPNVPPLSPRFVGPPPPVSVKRKALFSPTGSRDIPHPVKFENLVPSICLYKHRFKDEEPPYFQLKHGKGRKSNLTNCAAANLLREYELVKANALPGTCADVLEHYQTTKATISRLKKRLKATGTTDSRKKGTSAASFGNVGRTSKADDPRIIKQTRDIYRKNRALKTRDVCAIGVQDGEGNNIGLTTVKKIKKKHFKTHGVTPRPRIVDQKHADAALADAEYIYQANFEEIADVDEKYFFVPGYHEKYTYHKKEEPPAKELYKRCKNKNHLMKIMVMAMVSQPKRSKDGLSWERDGKVGIWRVTEEKVYEKGIIEGYTLRPDKRFTKQVGKMVREPVYSRKAGDKYQVDCSMDGAKYCEMMVQTNGHCPSHNALDQAVWTHLASRVRKRVNEFKEQMPKDKLLDLLWKVIEEEFWAMDPEILDDCFWSKDEAAKDTIRLKGWSKGKQEHSQVRITKKKYLQSMGWKRIPHQLPKALADIANDPNKKGYWDFSSGDESL
ncbi:unnamed protein product [Pelagomonas calceolata]|uniref:Uncharacterized protein n=1 Tax=Pelagomonas calceolata TaxID=35677 RepID=A0A8J2SG71_9STRA|nr:unnamed protein product [Pelagomonas calceolata]